MILGILSYIIIYDNKIHVLVLVQRQSSSHLFSFAFSRRFSGIKICSPSTHSDGRLYFYAYETPIKLARFSDVDISLEDIISNKAEQYTEETQSAF